MSKIYPFFKFRQLLLLGKGSGRTVKGIIAEILKQSPIVQSTVSVTHIKSRVYFLLKKCKEFCEISLFSSPEPKAPGELIV